VSLLILPYILLRGKEFELPETLSLAIIGLFLGIVFGLFYYHHYRKSIYWMGSMLTGMIGAIVGERVVRSLPRADMNGIQYVLLVFILPTLACFAINHYFYVTKKRYDRRRKKQRHHHSTFFDTATLPSEPRATPTEDTIADE
jgi:uncharacterized membrane protein YfcA